MPLSEEEKGKLQNWLNIKLQNAKSQQEPRILSQYIVRLLSRDASSHVILAALNDFLGKEKADEFFEKLMHAIKTKQYECEEGMDHKDENSSQEKEKERIFDFGEKKESNDDRGKCNYRKENEEEKVGEGKESINEEKKNRSLCADGDDSKKEERKHRSSDKDKKKSKKEKKHRSSDTESEESEEERRYQELRKEERKHRSSDKDRKKSRKEKKHRSSDTESEESEEERRYRNEDKEENKKEKKHRSSDKDKKNSRKERKHRSSDTESEESEEGRRYRNEDKEENKKEKKHRSSDKDKKKSRNENNYRSSDSESEESEEESRHRNKDKEDNKKERKHRSSDKDKKKSKKEKKHRSSESDGEKRYKELRKEERKHRSSDKDKKKSKKEKKHRSSESEEEKRYKNNHKILDKDSISWFIKEKNKEIQIQEKTNNINLDDETQQIINEQKQRFEKLVQISENNKLELQQPQVKSQHFIVCIAGLSENLNSVSSLFKEFNRFGRILAIQKNIKMNYALIEYADLESCYRVVNSKSNFFNSKSIKADYAFNPDIETLCSLDHEHYARIENAIQKTKQIEIIRTIKKQETLQKNDTILVDLYIEKCENKIKEYEKCNDPKIKEILKKEIEYYTSRAENLLN